MLIRKLIVNCGDCGVDGHFLGSDIAVLYRGATHLRKSCTSDCKSESIS